MLSGFLEAKYVRRRGSKGNSPEIVKVARKSPIKVPKNETQSDIVHSSDRLPSNSAIISKVPHSGSMSTCRKEELRPTQAVSTTVTTPTQTTHQKQALLGKLSAGEVQKRKQRNYVWQDRARKKKRSNSNRNSRHNNKKVNKKTLKFYVDAGVKNRVTICQKLINLDHVRFSQEYGIS